MKRLLPLILCLGFFLLIKGESTGIRVSDTNIYFYTAYKILEGKLLYKDIFFTNFPLLPYISVVYFLLGFGNLNFFYFTATLDVIATTILMYCINIKQTRNSFAAFISSITYLFSFLVLSTSDHQTGVFIASFFAVCSYWFYMERKYLFVGFFVALTILVKAYFLPVFLVYLCMSRIDGKKPLINFLCSFSFITGMILLPFLLLSPHELFRDIIGYSLTRSQGIAKPEIVWFFISHDTLLFFLLVSNIFFLRKQLFFCLFSIFSIIFFVFYQDIYYLYLNFLAPFLCLSLPQVVLLLRKHVSVNRFIFPTFIIIFLIYNIVFYLTSFRDLQKITDLKGMVDTISQLKPRVLYGINDLTPALSYVTHTPLLDNAIDTNTSLFRKGLLSRTKLTRQAIDQHGLLVSQGIFYPDGPIQQDILDEIFDKPAVYKACKLIRRFPIHAEGVTNTINFISCQ